MVRVLLPSLLHPMADGRAQVDVEASTLAGALDALCAIHPSLRIHLFDETGALRPHVFILLNGANSRWHPSLNVPVKAGDQITVMQAVSGG